MTDQSPQTRILFPLFEAAVAKHFPELAPLLDPYLGEKPQAAGQDPMGMFGADKRAVMLVVAAILADLPGLERLPKVDQHRIIAATLNAATFGFMLERKRERERLFHVSRN